MKAGQRAYLSSVSTILKRFSNYRMAQSKDGGSRGPQPTCTQASEAGNLSRALRLPQVFVSPRH